MNGKRTVALIILVLGSVIAGLGQTTSLTYQGNLTSAGSPANGSFDFEFALFDSQSGGSQLGPTLIRTGVDVSSGIFSVQLDFGSQFPGANRFLEIRVRSAGGGALTVLSPRQPFTSAPYAIRSLSSANAVTAQTATNSQNATNATTAATAGTFTGNLAGDVIGTQVSTTVAKLQGRNLANTPPTNGQVIKYNSTNSRWEPAADEAGAGGGGTITGVAAGTGLTGGGASGNVSLGIANGGVGTPQLADGSVTDPKIVSVSGNKVTGTVANAANAAAATTSLTAASFTGPLSGDVTGTQAATSVTKLQGRNVANSIPANGQVLKFNSTENRWEPAVDETGSSSGGTITGVTAGTGLTGGGATGNVGLGIANGGVSTSQLADGSVTDPKIGTISGSKVTGTVANAANAAAAATSLTASSFTGPLLGDVTGTQAATSVTKLQGRNVANSIPANGQVLKFNSTENRWEPAVDETGSSSGGTITGVTAGTGLTGGGATGNVGLGIANGGVGTAQLADGSVTDAKIVAVSGGKVTGTVSNAASAASAINSLQLGGVAANQFVLTGDSRLSDPRQPLSGSSNYIQNQSGASQVSSNFNISGTGKASIFDAASQFYIGGGPALSFGTGIENLHVGGASPSSTGAGLTFVGRFAGFSNTSGANNSFIGSQAGRNTTTGNGNAFVGQAAGLNNTSGGTNTFIGVSSGNGNTGGHSNTFVGSSGGNTNTTGSNNTTVGAGANVAFSNLSYATSIGAGSTVVDNNSVVLGRSADTVRVPGILSGNNISGAFITGTRLGAGTGSPTSPVHAVGEIFSDGGQAGFSFSDRGTPASKWQLWSNGFLARLSIGGSDKLAVDVTGKLSIGNLDSATSTHVCWNSGSGYFAFCSSSRRYKNDIWDYAPGLEIVSKLRPVSFAWKSDHRRELGFIAEEVADIEPYLAFKNKEGEIEGVNYDKITTVLVNAVNEQQSQIEQQKKTIDNLEKTVQSLKAALCVSRPDLKICK